MAGTQALRYQTAAQQLTGREHGRAGQREGLRPWLEAQDFISFILISFLFVLSTQTPVHTLNDKQCQTDRLFLEFSIQYSTGQQLTIDN